MRLAKYAKRQLDTTDGPPLDRGAQFLFYVLRMFSPSWWLIARPSRTADKAPTYAAKAAAYQIGWLALLVILLVLGRPAAPYRTLVVVLVTVRLLEIATYSLGLVLAAHWPKTAGSLVTVGLYAVQMALAFAILTQALVPYDFVNQSAAPHVVATSPFGYLYVSWTNMTTLGSEFTPTSGLARLIRLTSVTSGLLLLSVIAARTLQAAYMAGQVSIDHSANLVGGSTATSSGPSRQTAGDPSASPTHTADSDP